MQRRLFVLGTAAAALAGCGFQLRQTGDYPFKTLFAGFPTTTPLGAELSRQLRGTGRIELLTEAKQAQQADVILDILQEQRQRVVVGTNASGQVRELQLRMTVKFRLRTPDGVEWIEPPNHETDDAWERSVKRNLDAVVAYLRAEEKARKAAEKRVARKSSEPVPRVEASEDLRRLRALWREMGDVLDRLEARP